jgi:hypothetical protein
VTAAARGPGTAADTTASDTAAAVELGITEAQATARRLVGIMTVGEWKRGEFRRVRHFRVTSSQDAVDLAGRLAHCKPAGRLAVHLTALAAHPRMRERITHDVAAAVVKATRAEPTRRGLLWTVSWYPRALLEHLG